MEKNAFDTNLVAENIQNLMKRNEIDSLKRLSELSNLSPSTLSGIVNGKTDLRVSNLLHICNALQIDPNSVLKGAFQYSACEQVSKNKNILPEPKYYVVLTSQAYSTLVDIFDSTTNHRISGVEASIFDCNSSPDEFISQIKNIIQNRGVSIDASNSALFSIFIAAINTENTKSKNNILKLCQRRFHSICIESDTITNHLVSLGNKPAISVTINNGCAITYRNNKLENLTALHAGGFPMTDIAGNWYIGCKAINHTINVVDGLEQKSYLSERVLAYFCGSINHLITCAYEEPNKWYQNVSNIVKELYYEKEDAYQIVIESAKLLEQKINQIQQKINNQLPVYLSGESSHLYMDYFRNKSNFNLTNISSDNYFTHGINILKMLNT